jgi:hypothetical protein
MSEVIPPLVFQQPCVRGIGGFVVDMPPRS